MQNNIILGGGLVALIARDILGDNWKLLPIGRSRYYSFRPPLVDNFIIRDDDINDYLDKWAVIPILYKVGYSYAGQIIFSHNITLGPYLKKLYGDNIPSHAQVHYGSRKFDFFGAGDCSYIYKTLSDKYKDELFQNSKEFGRVNIIDGVNREVQAANKIIGYDRILSTVPLDALLKWCGVQLQLPFRDSYFYHINTDEFDFDGANIVYVVDNEILFHKVSQISNNNYIVESCNRIENPGSYFMQFIKKFDLLAETSVQNSICCGSIPSVPELDEYGITRVGSSVWDDCLDIGSCIKRIIKYGADQKVGSTVQ